MVHRTGVTDSQTRLFTQPPDAGGRGEKASDGHSLAGREARAPRRCDKGTVYGPTPPAAAVAGPQSELIGRGAEREQCGPKYGHTCRRSGVG